MREAINSWMDGMDEMMDELSHSPREEEEMLRNILRAWIWPLFSMENS